MTQADGAGKIESDSSDVAEVTLKEPVREPVDVAPPEPAARAIAAPRRGGLVGGVLGGVVAAAAGFGLAQFVPDGWPLADTTALQARVVAQDQSIAEMQSQIAALTAAQLEAPSEAPMPDPGMISRIGTLEEALAALPTPPDTQPLENRLAALEVRLAAIEAIPTDGTNASAAAVAAQAAALAGLRAEIDVLKSSGGTVPADVAAVTAAAEARMTEVETLATRMRADAQQLVSTAITRAAFGRVQAALDSGGAYASALADLGPDVPAVLVENASAGLPTLAELQAAFPETARLALEAALRADMGESWTQRVGSFLRSQTGARSLTPRDGADPDAVLSRAEAAVNTGDIPAALSELAALPPEAVAVAAIWRAQAELRLAAEAAVADLARALGE